MSLHSSRRLALGAGSGRRICTVGAVRFRQQAGKSAPGAASTSWLGGHWKTPVWGMGRGAVKKGELGRISEWFSNLRICQNPLERLLKVDV